MLNQSRLKNNFQNEALSEDRRHLKQKDVFNSKQISKQVTLTVEKLLTEELVSLKLIKTYSN